MKSWSPSFEKLILDAPDYRSFLQAFFQKPAKWEAPKSLSFQEFANRAGFASKSFLKDVVANRKRLTPRSFTATIQGLGLTKEWAEYFHCLVAIEESAFQSRQNNKTYYQNRLRLIKAKIRKRKAGKTLFPTSPSVKVFLEEHFPEVYASLGSLEEGESIPKICQKTNLSKSEVSIILDKMTEVGMVTVRGSRYYPLAEALNIEELKSTEVFQRDFFRSLEKAKKRFSQQAKSSEALFMTQTFSIQSQKLNQFREQLADLIFDFTVSAESAQGDCITELVVAFTNTRAD